MAGLLQGWGGRSYLVYFKFAFYGAMTAVLFMWGRSANPAKVGFVNGLVMAEIVTWAIRNAWGFMFNIIPFTLEAMLYGLLCIVLYGIIGIALPEEGEALAVAFLVFMFVATLKTGYYMMEYVSGDTRELGED